MRFLKALFSRLSFMILMVILEFALIYNSFIWLGSKAAWLDGVLRLLSVLIILNIIRTSHHLSSDMIWILLITLFPVPGTAVYMLVGGNLLTSPTFRAIQKSTQDSTKYYHQDPSIIWEMQKAAPYMQGQFRYISDSTGFPFYKNQGFDYYGSGEEGFPVMLEELRRAEKFIFLEYFIISPGKMWDSILAILEQKAKNGLDVRVMYDDLGSFLTLKWSYARELEAKGIKVVPFNRINPVIGAIINHRDHRKIMVIDGKVAFSGGINLADEYINIKKKYGHWKDNLIRVKGEAVWSYTVMFLTHWNALRKTDEDFEVFKVAFRPETLAAAGSLNSGFVAPYGETPLDDEITAQNVYMNILNQANEYCFIATPYLIIDTELQNALILAAKRGVDVRILTPGIPDKKLVWRITRSYYRALVEGGVKIFEYTPGFIHSKFFVADDMVASVGTINLDYRSLYLHFENSCYTIGKDMAVSVKKDFLETQAQSHQMLLSECRYRPSYEFLLSALRLVAPLM